MFGHFKQRFVAAAVLAGSVASAIGLTARESHADGSILWSEHFDHEPVNWVDPFKHSASTIARVYTIEHADAVSFLHAHYDGVPSDRPPAVHFGRAFQTGAPELSKVAALKWRWRALRQPNVSGDAWLDMAASIYVVIRQPSMIRDGRGFKFGWLSKPGVAKTTQHGIIQIAQRTDAPSSEWKEESVDLCALYRADYGPCEGEHVLFVGVVTDGDNTHSDAMADYADFRLVGN